MRDSRTRRLRKLGNGAAAFFSRYHAVLVVLSGGSEGSEVELKSARLTLGRGPEANLRFDDRQMSALHASFDTGEGGVEIRDLDSTNGIRVNGAPVKQAELKHGDRLEVGEHVFQFVVEEREPPTRMISFSES